MGVGPGLCGCGLPRRPISGSSATEHAPPPRPLYAPAVRPPESLLKRTGALSTLSRSSSPFSEVLGGSESGVSMAGILFSASRARNAKRSALCPLTGTKMGRTKSSRQASRSSQHARYDSQARNTPPLLRTEDSSLRIGLQVPRFTWPDAPDSIGSKLAEIGRTAEEAGFASIWVMDHFFQIGAVGEVEEPMLEGYSALSYLAGITERVKLGTLVTGVHYRYPGILLKTATTLDVLSGGRAYLGIGAGWFERESRGLGVPFPSTGERFERLEEALQIAHQMWSDEAGPYHGVHYHLEETLNSPQALTRPPIMIGGMGERKTLRLVAQYA